MPQATDIRINRRDALIPASWGLAAFGFGTGWILIISRAGRSACSWKAYLR
jgi:hypothetical protein